MRRWMIASIAAFCLSAVLLPWVGPGMFGPDALSLARVLHRQVPDYTIFTELRISRTLLALFAGGALSLAGSLFQAMLRDALADPYTLGISTGASLGAVVVICAGWQSAFGIPAIWVGSLAGALAVLLLVVGGAVRNRQMSAFGLLLTGLAANSVCSALIVLLHSLSSLTVSFSITHWLIGSIDSTSYSSLGVFIAVVAAAGLLVVWQARSWNLLAVGEQWAASRGVRVQRLMLTGYLAGSVLTAGAIALTGPIGFVGLIVPHLVRSRINSDHRMLMPCAFLLGGSLLAVCDALSRAVLAPAEVPTGVILALIGGPYLVWLVRQRI